MAIDQAEEIRQRLEARRNNQSLPPLAPSSKSSINQPAEDAAIVNKCPKCGYERKVTDFAPDWQCPSCGVAYVKVSGATSSLSSESASNKVSETKTSVVKSRYTLSIPIKILLVGFVCLTVGYFAGREHLKYELRQTFIAASEKIKRDLSSTLRNNNISDSKSNEKEYKPEEERQKPFSISLIKKGFMEHNYQANIPSDAITFTIAFTNLTGKNIRAFDGRVIFTDLLGNEILIASLAINDPISADSKIEWDGQINFNQFIDHHQKLRSAEFANINIAFEAKKILFDDGSVEEY